MTSTAAPITPARHATKAAAAPTAAPAAPRTQAEHDARVTRQLALATGASILVILVFFLAMMIVISRTSGAAY